MSKSMMACFRSVALIASTRPVMLKAALACGRARRRPGRSLDDCRHLTLTELGTLRAQLCNGGSSSCFFADAASGISDPGPDPEPDPGINRQCQWSWMGKESRISFSFKVCMSQPMCFSVLVNFKRHAYNVEFSPTPARPHALHCPGSWRHIR